MMLGSLLLIALSTFSAASPLVSRQQSNNSSISVNCGQFRYVPAIVNSSLSGSSWLTPPPSGWGFGHFFLSDTTQQAYLQLANLQTDIYPILPTSNTSAYSQIDLTSFQFPPNNGSDIVTIYAVDTALTGNLTDYSFAYNATSSNGTVLEQYSYAWTGWGEDASGEGFYVVYRTSSSGTIALPPALDIYSRVEGGPDNATTSAIVGCISGLAGNDVKTLAGELTKTTVDGRRTGQPPISCDTACQGNTGS